MEVDQQEVCSDSQLVVKQIEDSYEARGEKMIIYLKKVRELLENLVWVQVRYVPRAENSQANALGKLATASQEVLDRRILVEHLPKPSININNKEIFPVMTAPSWMDPIWGYLLNGTLPSDSKEVSCKTRENSNFLKKGKMVISVKIQNFSRSRMTKRTSPLESSREI